MTTMWPEILLLRATAKMAGSEDEPLALVGLAQRELYPNSRPGGRRTSTASL